VDNSHEAETIAVAMPEYKDVRCEKTLWRRSRGRLRERPCGRLLFQGEMVGRIKCKSCGNTSDYGVARNEILPDVNCEHVREKRWAEKPEPCGRLLFEGSMVGEIKCLTCGQMSHFQQSLHTEPIEANVSTSA